MAISDMLALVEEKKKNAASAAENTTASTGILAMFEASKKKQQAAGTAKADNTVISGLKSYYDKYTAMEQTIKDDPFADVTEQIKGINSLNKFLAHDVEQMRSTYGDEWTDEQLENLRLISEGAQSIEQTSSAAGQYKNDMLLSLIAQYQNMTDEQQQMYSENSTAFNTINEEQQNISAAMSRLDQLLPDWRLYGNGETSAEAPKTWTENQKKIYQEEINNITNSQTKISELTKELSNSENIKKYISEQYRLESSAKQNTSQYFSDAFEKIDDTNSEMSFFDRFAYNESVDKINNYYSEDGTYKKYSDYLETLAEGDTSFDLSEFVTIVRDTQQVSEAMKNSKNVLQSNDKYNDALALVDEVLQKAPDILETKVYYDMQAELELFDKMTSEEIGQEVARLTEQRNAIAALNISGTNESVEMLDALIYQGKLQMVGKTDETRAKVYQSEIQQSKDIEMRMNTLKNSLSLAKEQYDKVKALYKSGACSSEEYQKVCSMVDQIIADYKTAEAEYTKVQENIEYYKLLESLNNKWAERTAHWSEKALATIGEITASGVRGFIGTTASALDTLNLLSKSSAIGYTFGKGMIEGGSISAGVQAVSDYGHEYLTEGGLRNSAFVQEIMGEGEYAPETDPLKTYDPSYNNVATKFLEDTASGIGAMLPGMIVTYATGGSSAAIQGVIFAASTFQQNYNLAINNGANRGEATAYATLTAGVAGLSERFIGDPLSKVGAAAKVSKAFTQNMSNPAYKTLINYAFNSLGEGAEEVIESLLDTGAQKITYDPSATVDIGELAYEGLVGAFVGGLMGTANISSDYKINKAVAELVNGYIERANEVKTAVEAQQLYNELISMSVVANKLASEGGEYSDNYKFQAVAFQNTANGMMQNLSELLADNADPETFAASIATIVKSAEEGSAEAASIVIGANMQLYEAILARTDLSEDVRTKLSEQYETLEYLREKYDLIDYSQKTDEQLTKYNGVNSIDYDITDTEPANVRAYADRRTGTIHMRSDTQEYGYTKQGVDEQKAHEALHLAVKADPKLLGRLANILKSQGVDIEAEIAKIKPTYIEQYKKDYYNRRVNEIGEELAKSQADINAKLEVDDTYLTEEVVAKYFGKVASELGLGNIVSDSALDKIRSKAKGAVGISDDSRNLGRRITAAMAQYNKLQQTKAIKSEAAEQKKNASKAEKEAKSKKSNEYLKYVGKKAEQILALLKRVKDGTFKDSEKVYFENVDDTVAETIKEKTGIDVSGFKVAIEARQLEHILKRHGKNGKSDNSMSNDSDIAKIEYVLNSPDDIRNAGKTQAYSYMKDGKNRTADTVLYEKSIGEQSYYVVQAVPDTKSKTLYIVSAFIGKPGYKKETSQLTDAHNVPSVTSNDGSAIVSKNSISNFEKKSNSKSEKTSKSQTSEKKAKSADTVYKKNTKLKVGDKVGKVTLVKDSDTGDAVTPRLRASFDRADMSSYILATVESLGDSELVGALEEELALMTMQMDTDLPMHDAVDILSEYVKDGEITPEQAAQILSEENVNRTGADIPTLVEWAKANDIRYSVAGDESATADGSMLSVAKYYWNMPGTDRANITKETGWWYDDVDGKWKYEISDSEMVFEPNGLVSDPQTLADYIKHDRLFAAYPQLKDVKVKFTTFSKKNKGGSYNPVTNSIALNENRTEAQQKKTLIHEIQHAIQFIEDFASGTNEDTAMMYLFSQEYHKVKNTAEYKTLSTRDERIEYVENRIHPDEAERETKIRDQYKDAHGEVEARETAYRMGYDDTELRENPRRQNNAPAIDRKEVVADFVDILSELGYTESEIENYKKRVGITNDEQRYVSESDLSKLARDDIRIRQGFDNSSEKSEPRGIGRTRRVSGRPEPLGRSDAGADTASEGQLRGGIRYSLEEPDVLPAVDHAARVENIIRLADMLQDGAENDAEYAALKRVKDNAEKIAQKYDELKRLRAERKNISFAKGPRDAARIDALSAEIESVQRSLNSLESALSNSQAAAPFKEIMQRKIQSSTAKVRHDYYERQKARTQSRHNAETRNKIKRVIADLNTLLNHPTKEKNVKIEMQDAIGSALSLGNTLFGKLSNAEIAQNPKGELSGAEEQALPRYRALTSEAEALQAKLDEARANGTDTADIEARLATIAESIIEMEQTELKDFFERENKAITKTSAKQLIGELKSAYRALGDSSDLLIARAYDATVYGHLEVIEGYIGDVTVREMNGEQLEHLYNAYKMIRQVVRNANKIFLEGKKVDAAKIAESIISEMRAIGKEKEYRSAKIDDLKSYGWNELKPVYAFRRIGSDTLMRIYKNMRKGEDVWARDVDEAANKIQKLRKKYGAEKWDNEAVETVSLSSGKLIDLNLQQMMSIYAYSKRPQALKHMEEGGFKFLSTEKVKVKHKIKGKLSYTTEYYKTSSTTYRMSEDDLSVIKGMLTKDQIAYVDEMQKYLSEDMAAKGNEVSRELYGIDLFKDKNYFPLMSDKDYIEQASTPADAVSLKNSGMTKATVQNANNPIVLQGFDEVWTNHVNKMSTYHAFVLGIETMNRVLGYNVKGDADNNVDPFSLQSVMTSIYGHGACDYLKQLVTDANGGMYADGVKNPLIKFVSLFKKNAVAASMSVMLQQPTAIARAMAYIDPKYFVHSKTMSHSDKWEELKKYAPVAIIKEIGGFDTYSSGNQAKQYILKTEYKGVKDKAKALVKDSDYRDGVLMSGAAYMDEVGWTWIWEAVKRETAEKTELDGEALLEAAGERFTEVVELTQVYDSVFSRSAYMRSKNDLTKMATAFMGESTTSVNMLFDARIQAKRGNISRKTQARIVGAVFASNLLGSLVKSLWNAGRDDDKDEPYIEKFLSTFMSNATGDIFIGNMLPFVKDLISVLEGWDVARSDMELFTNLKDAITGMWNEQKSIYRKAEDMAGAVGAFVGIPAKNIMRDLRTGYNLAMNAWADIANQNFPSGEGMWQAFAEGITDNVALSWLSDSWRENYSTKQIDTELERLKPTADENGYDIANISLDKAPPTSFEIDNGKYTLSRAEQREWYDVRSENAAKLYTELLDSILYYTLSEEDKVNALKSIYSYSNYLAKKDYCEANGIEWENEDNEKITEKLEAGFSIAQLMWEKYTFEQGMKKCDKLTTIANSPMSQTEKLEHVYSLFVSENEDGELVTTKYDNIKAACDAGAPLSLVAKFMTYFSTVESSKDENGRTVYTGVDGETAYNKKELMKRWLDETWHELNDNGEFVQITEKMRHYVFATQYSSNNPYRAK